MTFPLVTDTEYLELVEIGTLPPARTLAGRASRRARCGVARDFQIAAPLVGRLHPASTRNGLRNLLRRR